VVSRLDRLARNVEGALLIMRELTERGVVFQNGANPV
jgi:DNA invertase Pin-like site-specific DNA recombinase